MPRDGGHLPVTSFETTGDSEGKLPIWGAEQRESMGRVQASDLVAGMRESGKGGKDRGGRRTH